MTLFEVMVSIAVLSIGALVAVGSMTTTSQLDASIAQRSVALRAALTQMEHVKAYDYGANFQNFVTHWSDPTYTTFSVVGLPAPVVGDERSGSGTTGGTQTGTQGGGQGGTYGAPASSPAPAAPPHGQITCNATDPNRVVVTVVVSWKGKTGIETVSLPMTFTGVTP